LGSDVRAQGLQKLLESAKGGAAGQKAQPSAAEQRNWVAGKLSEFGAKEKALDPEVLAPNCARPTCRKHVPMKFSAPCERSFGIIKPPLIP
jgi:hypothetical protein